MLDLKVAAPAGFPSSFEAPIPWLTIMSDMDRELRSLLIQYQNGLAPATFFQRFDDLLFRAHSDAHFLGQFDAGGSPSRGFARLRGRVVADEDSYYLRGFVDDLIGGRYMRDGELNADAVLRRMGLYQGKVRGSATVGFVDGSQNQDLFFWILGGHEAHCSDCPELAAMSISAPFSKSTLFQYPGDGSTPCLGHCKCYLKRIRDGAESQRPS